MCINIIIVSKVLNPTYKVLLAYGGNAQCLQLVKRSQFVTENILFKASSGTSTSIEVVAESSDKPVSLTTYKMTEGQPS